MDLKVVAVLVCLSALAISSTEAAIPGCCISTRKHIPFKVLMYVTRWTVQKSDGACDIDAVILHMGDKGRRVCLDPAMFKNLMVLKEEWKKKQWKWKVHKRAAN